MTDKKLTFADAGLASLNARADADGFLLDLIQYADSRMGFPIALLTNGMIVLGVLASAGVVAEHLDRNRRRVIEALEVPGGISAEEWATSARL